MAKDFYFNELNNAPFKPTTNGEIITGFVSNFLREHNWTNTDDFVIHKIVWKFLKANPDYLKTRKSKTYRSMALDISKWALKNVLILR